MRRRSHQHLLRGHHLTLRLELCFRTGPNPTTHVEVLQVSICLATVDPKSDAAWSHLIQFQSIAAVESNISAGHIQISYRSIEPRMTVNQNSKPHHTHLKIAHKVNSMRLNNIIKIYELRQILWCRSANNMVVKLSDPVIYKQKTVLT